MAGAMWAFTSLVAILLPAVAPFGVVERLAYSQLNLVRRRIVFENWCGWSVKRKG